MEQLKMEIYPNGIIKLLWNGPKHFGGYLNYYTLRVSNAYKNSFYKLDRNVESCIINSFAACENDEMYFSIRAVNTDDNIELDEDTNFEAIQSNDTVNCFGTEMNDVIIGNNYYGNWSPSQNYYCQHYSSLLIVISRSPVAKIIILCLIFILILALGFIFSKFYKKIQELKDIHMIWPEELDPKASITCKHVEANDNTLSDLDLIRNHNNLSNIYEEEEDIENEKELQSHHDDRLYYITKCIDNAKQNVDNNSNVHLKTSIVNSKTLEEPLKNVFIFDERHSQSLPTSPLKRLLNLNDSSIDNKSGYMKMYQPKPMQNASTVGYLDMHGSSPTKSTLPSYDNICNNINDNNAKNLNDAYQIKSFIRQSQDNNGYIQRNSLKNSLPTNSNGYIGVPFSKN
jgi:hypothetical protein